MNVIGTQEAAEKLGLSVERVRQLIQEGKISAQKVGRDWIIPEQELDNVKVYGKAGRPKKLGR